MNKKTIQKKKLSKECWSLDYSFYCWLKERLPVYLKEAGSVVNLDYHKFEYNGVELTQKQVIERMIELLDIPYDVWEEEYITAMDEVLDLWKLVFHAMWW